MEDVRCEVQREDRKGGRRVWYLGAKHQGGHFDFRAGAMD